MIYETKEKLTKRALKKLSWCANVTVYEVDWIKLLTGFMDLKYGNKIIHQDNNYCYLGIKPLIKENFTLDEFLANVIGNNSSQYFLNNRINNSLFKNLLNELSLFFVAKSRECHIEAFVHLYRIIEKMSIMFPLLYFKQSSNFKNVYNDLKKLLKDDKGGLKFYKNFQDTIFSEKSLLDNSIYFNFMISAEGEIRELKSIYENLFSSQTLGISFINNRTMVVPFGRVIDFAVTIRNRYFHLSMEHNFNIEPIELDMNLFFESINDNVLNWIGVVYYEMFKILNKL